MNKKLSFFESIYLNKRNKELVLNPNTNNSDNLNNDDLILGNVNSAPVNLVKELPAFEELTSTEAPIKEVPTKADELSLNNFDEAESLFNGDISLNKITKISDNITTTSDFSDAVDTSDVLNVSEENLTQNSNQYISEPLDNVHETVVDNVNVEDSDILQPETTPTKKKKKKKKKKTTTSDLVSTDLPTNDADLINEHVVNDNKNIQSNIDGIGDVLNKVVLKTEENLNKNVNSSLFETKNEELTSVNDEANIDNEDDALFLHIEIPSDELEEIDELNSDVFDDIFAALNDNNIDNADEDVVISLNEDVIDNFREETFNTTDETANNDGFGVMHFDLDDQLSDLDLEGDSSLIEKSKNNVIEEELLSNNDLFSDNLSSLDDSQLSNHSSEYDPKYRNSFEEDEAVTNEFSTNPTENESTNTSFALLDELESDTSDENTNTKDNEETKINIPLI